MLRPRTSVFQGVCRLLVFFLLFDVVRPAASSIRWSIDLDFGPQEAAAQESGPPSGPPQPVDPDTLLACDDVRQSKGPPNFKPSGPLRMKSELGDETFTARSANRMLCIPTKRIPPK